MECQTGVVCGICFCLGNQSLQLGRKSRTVANDAQANPADGVEEVKHAVVRQTVECELAVAACTQQPGAQHGFQMLRSVGHGEPRCCGERIDVALTLGKVLQKYKPVGVRRRLCDCHARCN